MIDRGRKIILRCVDCGHVQQGWSCRDGDSCQRCRGYVDAAGWWEDYLATMTYCGRCGESHPVDDVHMCLADDGDGDRIDDFEKIKKAWDTLVDEIAKELGIYKLLDFLVRLLDRWRV